MSMSFVGKFAGNTNKALIAGAITAGMSYWMHGSGSIELVGIDIPLFLIQGASVAGGVFITENVKDFILPITGVKDIQTITYLVEPAITGVSSAILMGVLTGDFNGQDFIKDSLVGMGATAGGHYVQNAL